MQILDLLDDASKELMHQLEIVIWLMLEDELQIRSGWNFGDTFASIALFSICFKSVELYLNRC